MKSIKEIAISQGYKLHLDAITGEAYLYNNPVEKPKKSLSNKERETMLQKILIDNKENMTNRTKIHAFVVDYKCNYDCDYCYVSKKDSVKLSENQVKNIYEIIEKTEGNQGQLLTLFGGEPLLKENASIVELILRMGKKRGFKFFITTNGYDLDHFIDLLEEINVVRVQVTLDTNRELYNQRRNMKSDSDPYEKVVNNIDAALQKGIRINMRMNIDENNVDYMPEFAQLIEKRNWFDKRFRVYFAPWRKKSGRCFQWFDEKVLKRLLEVWPKEAYMMSNEMNRRLFIGNNFRLQFNGCRGTVVQKFYDGNGDIYPCIETLGIETLKIGTYDQTIQFSENYQKLLQRNVLETEEKCKDCDELLFCGGGCPYKAYLNHGDLSSSDCGSRMEVDRYLKLLGKMMLGEFARKVDM